MDWREDRQRVKVINMENRGQDIELGCQGVRFVIKDQAVVSIPKLVIENLRNAVTRKWKVSGNMNDPGRVPEITDEPRFTVIEMPESALTDDDKKRLDLMKEAQNEMSTDYSIKDAVKKKGK